MDLFGAGSKGICAKRANVGKGDLTMQESAQYNAEEEPQITGDRDFGGQTEREECVAAPSQNKSRKAQWALIALCWLMYTMEQLGRYSYSSNVNPVMEKFGISHAKASMPATLFFFAYGAGQIVNAFLCKRYNKRWVLGGVLFLSGAVNLIIFIGVPFMWIGVLWFVNGLVQSVLWGSIILTLSNNLDQAMLARASFVMSTATLGGTFLSYGLSALLAIGDHYESAFCVSGAVLLVVCALWVTLFNRVAVQKKEEKEKVTKEETAKNKMSRTMIFTVATLAVFTALGHLVSGGLQTWMPTILTETYGLSNAFSVFLTVFLPFVGVFSSALAELMYKCTGNFIILNGIVFAVAAIALIVLIQVVGVSWISALLLFIAIRLAMGVSANSITSRFPLYMRKQGNSGFLAGFLNGSCYVGQATSTYGFGAIADRSGWQAVFWASFYLCLLPIVCTVIYGGIILWKKRRAHHGI